MKDKEIFSQAWCEMLFEGRNRAYGAYVMRRDAGHRYARALQVVGAFFLAFFIAAICMGLFMLREAKDVIAELDQLQKLERIKPKSGHEFHDMAQGRKSVPIMKPNASMARPEIVDGITLTLDFGIDGPEQLHVIEDENVIMDHDTLNAFDPTLPEEGIHLSPTEVVEEMPKFPGGVGALMKWLDAHIIYTYASMRARVEGDMEITFIVDKEGRITEPTISKSLNPSLDRTALAAIKDMPRWEPARSNGRLTRVQVTLPIHFDLAEK